MNSLDQLKREFKDLQDELSDAQQTERDLEGELWEMEEKVRIIKMLVAEAKKRRIALEINLSRKNDQIREEEGSTVLIKQHF